jgi:CHASE2 domain-containing sensor protein/signal transduction histidine kinase
VNTGLPIKHPVIDHLASEHRRRALSEWLALAALAITISVIAITNNWFDRLDVGIYDIGVRTAASVPRDDIVIVAIDDVSISAIGRWPWRRSILADLIDKISAARPRAIGLDIILSESDVQNREDDLKLARSIRSAHNVVLPTLAEVSMGGISVQYRQPLFDAAMGHINLHADSDGIARGVFLVEGTPGNTVNHFALTLANLGYDAKSPNSYRQEVAQQVDPSGWVRSHLIRISFSGPPGAFRQISASYVLDGSVDPKLFSGKTALIGATAGGLGYVIATPLSHDGRNMSGVEILANSLQTLLDDTANVEIPRPLYICLTVLFILITSITSLCTSPRSAFIATITAMVVALGAALLMLSMKHVWFKPATAILVSVFFYAVWSWRRQEAALAFLNSEAERLAQEPSLGTAVNARRFDGNSLETRMAAVVRVTTRLRDLQQFLADGIESLPNATIICTVNGHIFKANRSGVALCPEVLDDLTGMSPPPRVESLISAIFQFPRAGLDYWDQLRSAISEEDFVNTKSQKILDGVELTSRGERQMLLQGVPLRNNRGNVAGIIVSIVDISALREAEMAREETLRFISHDMRSPQTSILALIALQRNPSTVLGHEEFLERIVTFATKTLTLADDFIRHAQASSHNLQLSPVELSVLLLDVADGAWALARTRHIKLNLLINVEPALVLAEPALLLRAIANLVDNAIKFSRGTVYLHLYRSTGQDIVPELAISIVDDGPGISNEDQMRLFQPFVRVGSRGDKDGIGLGLAFVKSVVELHGGRIQIDSNVDVGTTFTILLPETCEVCKRI